MSCWNVLEYCVNTSGDVGGGLAGSGGNWLSAVSGGLPGFGLQKGPLGVSHGIAVSYLYILLCRSQRYWRTALRFWMSQLELEYHDLLSLFEFLDNGDGEITWLGIAPGGEHVNFPMLIV